MEPTTPHSRSSIFIHCGRLVAAAVIELFLQRMTSSGALSSDWKCRGQQLVL